MIKKTIIIALFTACLTIAILLAIVNFTDYTVASKNLFVKLNISSQNTPKIQIVKFPIPHLKIDSLKREGNWELENIDIYFTPLSLLTFKPKISSLKISKAQIYSEVQEDLSIINHDELVNLIIMHSMIDINFDIKNLNIVNKDNQPIVTLKNFSLSKNSTNSNISSFKGESNLGKISGFFEKNMERTNFDLTIDSSDYNFYISEVYQDAKLINGMGKYSITNLSNILSHLVPELNYLFKKFTKNEIINIIFDLLPTEKLLKLENIMIDSSLLLGNGSVYLSKKDDIASIIKLHFSKIDTTKLVASSNTPNQFNDLEHGLKYLFGNKSIITDIVIDQIILNKSEILNDIKLLLNLNQEKIVVQDFSGTIKSGGNFKFIGNISQNSVRSVFDGNIIMQHNDLNSILTTLGYPQATSIKPTPFSLSSDLKLTLIDIYLKNLLLKVENTEIIGDITARFIGFMPHLVATLEFSSINLDKDDYPIISPIIYFAKDLSKNMKEESYLNKFIQIRTISYLGNFDISVNNLIIKDESFGRVNMLVNVAPNNIQISNLDIRKNNDYINVTAHLLATDVKPQLEIKINNGTVNVNFLTGDYLLGLRNKLLNEFDLEKIDLKLDCALSTIAKDDLVLDNLKFSLENNNNLFKINNLEAQILSGKLVAEGNILLDPCTLNFVYALNFIDLAKLSNILPKGLLDNYGVISINGQLSTNGDSEKQLLYELNGQSEFVVKNAKINNFSVDSLVEKINNKDYKTEYLKSDLAKAMTEGKTELTNLHGTFQLQNGIITSKDLLFNTKYSTGTATLALNIYNFEIALSSIFSFYIADVNYPPITPPKALVPVNLKINASGTIFNPIKVFNDIELTKSINSHN